MPIDKSGTDLCKGDLVTVTFRVLGASSQERGINLVLKAADEVAGEFQGVCMINSRFTERLTDEEETYARD